MGHSGLVNDLIAALLAEPWARQTPPEIHEEDPRAILRGLMNLRPPVPADPSLLAIQDQLLQGELAEKTVTKAMELSPCPRHPCLALWRGDITTLEAGAIVNAVNSALLGCFLPCHRCIDNAIHSAAGIQLRLACHALMEAQGHAEPPGGAKLTPGYNLPARYVIHTVGPKVKGPLTQTHREQLAGCYRSCLDLARDRGLDSVAFCCISTGVYGFPRKEAAAIAVETVLEGLDRAPEIERVIFNVFEEKDYDIYRRLLA